MTYCANRGSERKNDEKFCAKCGKPFLDTQAVKPQTSNQKKASGGIFSMFNISDEDLKSQVDNHDTLPITKTSRGVAVMTIAALLALGSVIIVALSFFATDIPVSLSDVIWSVVLYLPFLYFVYRGHLWAIVGLALLYTADKVMTVAAFDGNHFNISSIIFWLIGIGPLWVRI
jgi:hypothetical protein